MPGRAVGVADTDNADAVVEVDVVERASPNLTTTTTADPGSAGTTLAVTANAKFPASGNYKIRVEAEVMRVTGGQGTNSWTVVRGIDGTTGVAHTIGVTVAHVVAVQRVEPIAGSRQTTYVGRVCTFRTPGRAAVDQKVFAIHNATGSKVIVKVNRIFVDVFQTAVKAVTIVTPRIRLYRCTVLPTNGTALTKASRDTALASSASVTVFGDASADGTGSGTTLTVTTVAGPLGQVFGPRVFTAVGYEEQDMSMFLEGEPDIILRPLEGLCVFLEGAVVTTGNPATDSWVVTCDWEEYTEA